MKLNIFRISTKQNGLRASSRFCFIFFEFQIQIWTQHWLPDMSFSWLPQSLGVSTGTVSQSTSPLFPSAFFPSHYLLMTLTFDTTQPEILTALLKISQIHKIFKIS